MSDLLLWSRDRKFGLSLNETILLEGLKECTDSGSEETGGILVGYYTPAHDCAVVTALGGPPEDSIRGPRLFERGTKGIQRWISRLWREQRHFYLGEWHYHPGGTPVPSPDDREQMQKLSKDRNLKCPEPILLIIGGNPRGAWIAKAYVFPVDKEYVALTDDGNFMQSKWPSMQPVMTTRSQKSPHPHKSGLRNKGNKMKIQDKIKKAKPQKEHALFVKEARAKLGLTQFEFAEALSVSWETVAKWEQGGRNPGAPTRMLIEMIVNLKS